MNIGLVTGEYPPLQGGVGAFTRELARALSSQGHEIHVFTSREVRRMHQAQNSQGETDRSLTSIFEPIDLGYAALHARGRRWHWRDIGLIADMVERYKLDVVNIQYQAAAYNMRNPAINFAPWRLNGLCKTVATFHDLRSPYLFPKAGQLRDWVVRLLARSAHGVIVTNGADETELRGQVRQLVRIPIGSNIAVDPAGPTTAESIRQEIGLRGTDFLLGYFGFLNLSKGADLLLEALAQLPENVHLVCIGGRTGASDPTNNAAFAAQLDQLIAQHKLAERVHFTGFLPDEKTSHYLAAVDLMVLPYRDGLSLRRGTLMAALAHGRPVISTQPLLPTPELTHSGAFCLVKRDDSDGIQAAIRHFVAQPELLAPMGAAALALADSFGWRNIAARTAAFFDSLVAI